MKNLITGAVIAALIISASINWMQYEGIFTAPENLTFVINQPSDDPIVQAAEAYHAGR